MKKEFLNKVEIDKQKIIFGQFSRLKKKIRKIFLYMEK